VTPPFLADEFSDLHRAIANSRAAILDGAEIDLTGLDAEVTRIAAAARTTAPDQRDAVLSAIEALWRDIDGLETDIRRQHDAALAQQAVGAYGAGRSAR
jgi:hypothetical protein